MEVFLGRPRRTGKPAAPNTVYREADTLRAFYKWIHDEYYTNVNVAAGLVTPKRPARNPRPIEDSTWRRLWAHDWSPRVRVVMGLGYFLGLRRAELWNLKIEQLTEHSIVDFVRKGGGEHSLKITNYLAVYENTPLLQPLLLSADMLMQPLGELRREASMWLVPGRDTAQYPEALNQRFTRWCRHADAELVTPHQLRHSAATNLARAGVPAHLIMAMLNHGSIDVTMRYIRSAGADMEEWIRATYRG
jgi:integrase